MGGTNVIHGDKKTKYQFEDMFGVIVNRNNSLCIDGEKSTQKGLMLKEKDRIFFGLKEGDKVKYNCFAVYEMCDVIEVI